MAEKNSIVTKVLAIARIRQIENALIKHLEYRFNEYLNDLRNWVAIEGEPLTYCTSNISDLNIDFIDDFDLITAGKNLGLHITVGNNSNFHFSIIKHVEGSEMRIAQKMLQEFQSNLLKRINEEETIAENTCRKILDMLSLGKFTSKKNKVDNELIITVSNIKLPKELNFYFLNTIKTTLAENGFYLQSLNSESGCTITIPLDK